MVEIDLELSELERQAGNPAESARIVEAAIGPLRGRGERADLVVGEALLARIDAEGGRAAKARRRLAGLDPKLENSPSLRLRRAFRRARAALARAEGRFGDARADLDTAIAAARAAEDRLDELELRLERAGVDLAAGAADRAAEGSAIEREATAVGFLGIAGRAARLVAGAGQPG